MDTDEEPSGLSLSSETETGGIEGDMSCIVVGILRDLMIGIRSKERINYNNKELRGLLVPITKRQNVEAQRLLM